MSKSRLRVFVTGLLSAGLFLGAASGLVAQDKPAATKKQDAAGKVETLTVDPVHSSVLFRVKHNNVAYVFGEFTEKSGTFKYDPAKPENSSFSIEVVTDSVQTHNDQRNAHLKSADFFDAKQFPKITFKSTKVKKGAGNTLEVTGDLTIHGKTNQVTALVQMTGKGENQQGKLLRGFYSTLNIKRSDYGMNFLVDGGVSDEVKLILSFETGAADAKK